MQTTSRWPDTHCPTCNADRGKPCKTKHDKNADTPHKHRATESDLINYRGINEMIVNPPDDRIIENGQYVTVIRSPHVRNYHWLEPGMTFWAEHSDTRNPKGFLPDGKYKIELITHKGSVCLWPYEYCVFNLERIKKWYSKERLVFHPTEIDPDEFSEQVHYLMSRGISKSKALGMSVGSMDQNIGWFEPTVALKTKIKTYFSGDRYAV